MRFVLPLAVIACLAAPAAAQNPTVDELIARNIESRGGEAKLKAINTRKVSGKVTAQGMEFTMQTLAKRPNKMYQEMSLQGRKIVTAYDGERAWAINPMMGGDTPTELSGPQADMLKDQAWFEGPLMGARQRGDKIEVVGKEDVEGTPAWKVAITKPSGQVTNLFLDEKTGLERQVTAEVGEGATKMQVKSVISDYQPVEGILVPRKVETLMAGRPGATITIDSVEFNAAIDDEQFTMPAGAAPAPAAPPQ